MCAGSSCRAKAIHSTFRHTSWEKPGNYIRASEIPIRSGSLPPEGSEIPSRTVLKLIFHEWTKLFNAW